MSTDSPSPVWKQWCLGYPGACCLLGVYWIVAVTAVLEKSTTYDEVAHLTAGYSYWLNGDYRLQPENGNLPQRFGTLPFLISQPTFPDQEINEWKESNLWQMASLFLHQSGNDTEELLLQARATMALWGVAVGLLVYVWSRSLFGPAGAMLSLIACVSCTTMLAHGPLVTSDMSAAFFFLASASAWWRLLHFVSPARFAVCVLALAGLFLAKFSAVLFIPIGLLLLGLRVLKGPELAWQFGARDGVIREQPRQLALLLGLGVGLALLVGLAIWAAFGFRFSASAEASVADGHFSGGWAFLLSDLGGRGRIVAKMRDWRLLPEAYLYGFAFTLKFAQQRSAFFNGELGLTGWLGFFPFAFLVKTSIPTLILLVAAAGAKWHDWKQHPEVPPSWKRFGSSLYSTAPLWMLMAVYVHAAVTSNLNIGHRHILPIYPVLYVLMGAAGYWFESRTPAPTMNLALILRNAKHPIAMAFMSLTMVLLVVESYVIYPHYLAYFNQFVGGPRYGYRHLVDSSLDWGQDLPGLHRWLDTNTKPGDNVYVSYFGTGNVGHYATQAKLLPCFGPSDAERPPPKTTELDRSPLQPGTYCISATMLQGVYTPQVFPGPWTAQHEMQYRAFVDKAQEYYAAERDPKAREARDKADQFWTVFFRHYDIVRLERLCIHLRNRVPDAYVGYSILIFRLEQADLDRALAPAPER